MMIMKINQELVHWSEKSCLKKILFDDRKKNTAYRLLYGAPLCVLTVISKIVLSINRNNSKGFTCAAMRLILRNCHCQLPNYLTVVYFDGSSFH